MKNVKINQKWDILLPEHRANRSEWFTKKGWERERLDSMHDKLGKGDVVFYVGAEEGEMPALCSMWGCDVILFEPNEKVWPNIKAIWKTNNLKDPWSFYGFASNEDVEGAKFINGFPECANGEIIANHSFKELRHAGDIPQIKIDTIVQSLHMVPDAISIDVEGSEWEVLMGAKETLKRHHPKIWLSLHPEFMFSQYKRYSFDLRRWIQILGYKETLIDYQHEVHLLYE